MRSYVKQADSAIASGDQATAEEMVRAAISEIDRAAKKGVIHRNNAARRKSRLMGRFNALD
jgi:small subunit ribosomal protein S20